MVITRVLARIGAVSAGCLLLAACDYGETRAATYVGDSSAQLNGVVHTDSEEWVTWWFEYGPTAELGAATPERSHLGSGSGGWEVAAMVTGLDEGTTYHYRHCVRNADDGVVCGARTTLTTTAGRDSVLGEGIVTAIPQLGYYVGAILEATSEPDGSSPAGHASRYPGRHYFRIPDEGPVTCLRVAGNRAAVGYTADYSEYDPTLPPVHVVLHVEDNGAVGDRFLVDVVTDPPTTCPDPDVALDAEPGQEVIMQEGFVVHDHP